MDEYQVYLQRLKRKQKLQSLTRYLPVILFIATVFTTLFAGAIMQYIPPKEILANPSLLLKGASFSFPLMLILLTHEMGHYGASRIHRVKATLPYFIPFPNFIGTFGAVIKMKSPMRDRRALMDIGAAGPIAGFILSIIAAAWGLAHSTTIPLESMPPETWWNPRIVFGPNLIFAALIEWFAPLEAHGGGLIVSPMMDAGWLGMFVTSLNLMPAGQLDGGHIAYAMLGQKRAHKLAKVVVGALILFGLPGFLMIFFPNMPLPLPLWPGYAVWGVIVITLVRLSHPPPLNPSLPLGKGRKLVGLLCLAIWIVTFTPVPFLTF